MVKKWLALVELMSEQWLTKWIYHSDVIVKRIVARTA